MSKIAKGMAIGALTVFLIVGMTADLAAKKETSVTFATPGIHMCFDPAQHIDSPTSAHVFNAYDPLVMPVLGKDPMPWLAESWKISKDGLTYTMRLRKGVKFHDGSEFTAEDVAFSMDRMLRLKKGYSWIWGQILKPGSTQAADRHTVIFRLEKPFGPFIATLVQFLPVNRKLIMANKEPGNFDEWGDYGLKYLQTHDAGSGAYTVEKVALGEEIIFRKFDGYWGGWKPNQVDVARWRVIPERATVVAMLKKGEVDMIDEFGTVEEYADLGKTPGVKAFESIQSSLYVIHMNVQKKYFDDINVRKAISYAFDYKQAVEMVFGGRQAGGPVPLTMPEYNSKVVVYQRDLKKAQEFLAQSKYKDELQKVELTYQYWAPSEPCRKTAMLLKSNLQDIGLNVKLQGEDWARMTEMATKPDTTGYFFGHYNSAKYPSADVFLYGMFHKQAQGTYLSTSWYSNPGVDELIDKARVETNTKKRNELYGKAQSIISEDAPIIAVANPAFMIAFRDRIQGFTMRGVMSYEKRFYDWRIKE